MDKLKITGTKSYADVEYKGNIARFDGELCVSSFGAILSSARWIKHKGNACTEDMNELIKEIVKYNNDKSNAFKLHLYYDNGNQFS